jgi:hypothetical protein
MILKLFLKDLTAMNYLYQFSMRLHRIKLGKTELQGLNHNWLKRR